MTYPSRRARGLSPACCVARSSTEYVRLPIAMISSHLVPVHPTSRETTNLPWTILQRSLPGETYFAVTGRCWTSRDIPGMSLEVNTYLSGVGRGWLP